MSTKKEKILKELIFEQKLKENANLKVINEERRAKKPSEDLSIEMKM
jgi:hypothetical protein